MGRWPAATGNPGHGQASQLVEAFLRFAAQENTVPLMQAALAASDRYRISYWDAAILEAARAMGCRTVLSKDLSHGRDYEGVVAHDPFRT